MPELILMAPITRYELPCILVGLHVDDYNDFKPVYIDRNDIVFYFYVVLELHNEVVEF